MKKIIIIGCSGAGKSTFAKELHKILNIELVHLDKHFWKPNYERTPRVEWEKTVSELTEKEEWIIDGNYHGTISLRIEKADTIFYLDFPLHLCLWRITKRILKWKFGGIKRDDITESCQPRFTYELYRRVFLYNKLFRDKYNKLLRSLSNQKSVIIFRTPTEIKIFLNNLFVGYGNRTT